MSNWLRKLIGNRSQSPGRLTVNGRPLSPSPSAPQVRRQLSAEDDIGNDSPPAVVTAADNSPPSPSFFSKVASRSKTSSRRTSLQPDVVDVIRRPISDSVLLNPAAGYEDAVDGLGGDEDDDDDDGRSTSTTGPSFVAGPVEEDIQIQPQQQQQDEAKLRHRVGRMPSNKSTPWSRSNAGDETVNTTTTTTTATSTTTTTTTSSSRQTFLKNPRRASRTSRSRTTEVRQSDIEFAMQMTMTGAGGGVTGGAAAGPGESPSSERAAGGGSSVSRKARHRVTTGSLKLTPVSIQQQQRNSIDDDDGDDNNSLVTMSTEVAGSITRTDIFCNVDDLEEGVDFEVDR